MPPLKSTVTDRFGFQGSTSMPRGDYLLQIWGKGSEKLWDEQEKERIFCDFWQYNVNMWYIRSSYGVPILTLSLSYDYPPIIFRLWCDTNSEIIAKEKEGINVLKNEHEVHNCDERSARKNASEVHNFMRKEQRNSGRRWLLKYASIASEHRNFSPTRKRTQKKRIVWIS